MTMISGSLSGKAGSRSFTGQWSVTGWIFCWIWLILCVYHAYFLTSILTFYQSETCSNKDHEQIADEGKEYDWKAAQRIQSSLTDKPPPRCPVSCENSIYTFLARTIWHVSLVLKNSFEDSTHNYLVMELCSRGDVCQHLKTNQKLDEHEACKLARQVCATPSYAATFCLTMLVLSVDRRPGTFAFALYHTSRP